MSDCLCIINISEIDLTDERYNISFSKKDIDFLAQSLKETGLIYPPIVRPLNNKFIVVSGFNRILAHIHNNRGCKNKKKICVYKTDSNTSDYQCLIKSITGVAFKRPLTQAELIICTKRLHQFLDEKQISQKSPAIFNTDISTRFIKDLLMVGNLPDPALELVHKGNISFKSAKKISVFQQDTIMVFLNIFSKIRASNNKQLEMITYIMDISARDAIAPEDFIKKQDVQEILSDEKKEPGLKTNLFRAYLFKLRFPTVFKTRQMVMEKILSIKLGNNIKFLPPENLDSQTYSINFTAKTYAEFASNVEKLNKSLKNKTVKEIFNQ